MLFRDKIYIGGSFVIFNLIRLIEMYSGW